MTGRAATIVGGLLLQLGCGRTSAFFDGVAVAGDSAGRASGASGGVGGSSGGSGAGAGGGSAGSPLGCAAPNGGLPSGTGCKFCPAWTRCETDPAAGIGCQLRCNTSADCPQLSTACLGSVCVTNVCGPGTTNGTSYGSPCNAAGANDGTCIAKNVSDELNFDTTIGVCYQGGAASGACVDGATRCDLQDACVAGLVCYRGSCG